MRNTVLIVEDDPLLQLFFSEELETLGWKTLQATSTRQAINIIAEHADTIAVVVTDVEMPGTRDGLTLASQVRFGWPAIGVVVVSGSKRPNPSDLPQGVAFYSKPLNVETLLSVVDDAMRYADQSLARITEPAE
jgi:two-component system, response regulator PdtaR